MSLYAQSRRSAKDVASPRRGGNFRKSRPKREIKTFDPSQFINKVEERTPAEEYTPKHSFADFAITPQLKTSIALKGYTSPTPIQDQAIPHILEGRDVVGTANTGTGKTAAFLIPLINNVITKKTERVLIIAPTRELAIQINQELMSFSYTTGISSAVCIGGANIHRQEDDLFKNPSFVIGTPGRLMDFEARGVISFCQYSTIVLDEVDRMLDMGFIRDIKMIISRLPKERHSLFFSATLSPEAKKIAAGFLTDPIAVSVKTRQSSVNVNQDVVRVTAHNKIDVLHDILIKPECTRTMIFLRTKYGVDKLAKLLIKRGFKVAAIHGDKSQTQRNQALAAFKNDRVNILLATDVVARGIDIDNVSHVINYDLPQTNDDYIHRIGRTGRADKVGQAITFVE